MDKRGLFPMYRSLSLLFLFSVTATLLIPSRSDAKVNTSVFESKRHSNSGLTTVKVMDKARNRRHLVRYADLNCSADGKMKRLVHALIAAQHRHLQYYRPYQQIRHHNHCHLHDEHQFHQYFQSDPYIEAFLTNHGALAQKRYKFSEVKKMTNSFRVKLGEGGFGSVYEGKIHNGCHVAVKLLNASKRNGEEFINEVATISRTSHVNIVSLLGFCLEGRKKALIYEFMANGSLDKFIYKRGSTIASLSWENLYQISIGIARGLEYLHRGCKTKILHFDIKPHNILLDENFCPKISDFGLAKLCPRKESIVSISDTRGTMGYVAPEMINRHFGGVSHKSDVYSYGMMLLEMVGGRKNINAEASHTSEIYFPHLVYRRLELDDDVRPDEAMNTEENEIAKRMTVVGLWCIQTLPNDRPTMSRVVEMLEDNMNSLEMPPKPLFSSPSRSITESYS
ncbi:unnamed protein product [Sphenostylis stenocarpa]|uniref:Protein kinase domain-containing protein n=1 Tax=Sphenostylis stenocarpa TaxID=92480 RepID=A0AA86ST39_9FABA|nr:unnamed protein product [Sphenostylis stenocarpa]